MRQLAENIVNETRSETRIFKILAQFSMKLLHVPIALDLGLVAVDTAFHLTCERKQVLVDDLGCLAVPLVLLCLLNVGVHVTLRLESVSTPLVGASERSLASVVH